MILSPMLLSTIMTTPMTLTPQTIGNKVFSAPFEYALMPIIYDLGEIIFKVAVIAGIYCIMRRDTKNGIDRIKMAVTGYIMLKFINIFTRLIDYAVSTIKITIP